MALDLDELDGEDHLRLASEAMGRVLHRQWCVRLEKWREIAKAAGSPDPALGFLTRLGALVNALRSIERGYPWGSIQEDFVYAETGRAPR